MHSTIIILTILFIIYWQIVFFKKNLRAQKELRDIFPNKGDCDSNISISNIDGVPLIIAHSDTLDKSPIFDNIVTSINGYLRENKGAASDFHLIKDVVDRNCDCVEEEVATLTPIPLYLGLIGTMFGILVGVGFLVFSDGLNKMLNAQNLANGNPIVELLGGVSLAMISSISGIGLTTASSYIYKGSKTELNLEKNAFFSWIQKKLLPTLSGNTTTAIYTLQQNLSTFNNTFALNIDKMRETFSVASIAQQDQLKLMQLVEKMDVTRMAKANVEVLKELQNNTHEFEKFNHYLHAVTGYLDKVQTLSSEINEHLNRTQVIEEMGAFFKNEINQIEERKGAISKSVGSVDITLQNSLTKLRESADKQLNEFVRISVDQNGKFSKVVEDQQNILSETIKEQQYHFTSIIEGQQNMLSQTIKEQQNQFTGIIEDQKKMLSERMEETSLLIQELKNLSAVKESMSGIEKATLEQNKRLENLTSVIRELVHKKNPNSSAAVPIIYPEIPKWITVSVGSSLCIVGVAGLIYIIPQIIHYIGLYFN